MNKKQIRSKKDKYKKHVKASRLAPKKEYGLDSIRAMPPECVWPAHDCLDGADEADSFDSISDERRTEMYRLIDGAFDIIAAVLQTKTVQAHDYWSTSTEYFIDCHRDWYFPRYATREEINPVHEKIQADIDALTGSKMKICFNL